jgi:hypothetical protein
MSKVESIGGRGKGRWGRKGKERKERKGKGKVRQVKGHDRVRKGRMSNGLDA